MINESGEESSKGFYLDFINNGANNSCTYLHGLLKSNCKTTTNPGHTWQRMLTNILIDCTRVAICRIIMKDNIVSWRDHKVNAIKHTICIGGSVRREVSFAKILCEIGIESHTTLIPYSKYDSSKLTQAGANRATPIDGEFFIEPALSDLVQN